MSLIEPRSGKPAAFKVNNLLVWVGFHGAVLVLFVWTAKISINTSLYSILPDASPVQVLSDVDEVLRSKLNSSMTALVGHEDFSIARQAAFQFAESVSRVRGIQHVQLEVNSNSLKNIQAFLHKYRYQFLSPEVVDLLQEGRVSSLAERAFFSISGPVSVGSLDYLDQDPFLLGQESFQYVLNSGILGNMAVGIRDSVLSRDFQGKSWVLVMFQGETEGFAVETDENPVASIHEITSKTTENYPGVEFLFSGIPFHSYDSTIRSQKQITLLSTISTLFIIFIILFVFRSFQPLFATFTIIGVGILTGLAMTLVIFSEIHIFTIVFGTSLIGISVDYSFHFFTTWSVNPQDRTHRDVIRHILPGISIGLLTTIISYGAFVFTPFPLLQQVALFSISGLVSTFISVVFIFPNLKAAHVRTALSSSKTAKLAEYVFKKPSNLSKGSRVWAVLILIGFTLFGFSRFRLDNDIRDFYKMSPQLMNWEMKTAEILDHQSSGIYFLVEGSNLEEALLREEDLIKTLESKPETVKSFLGTSLFLPSKLAQTRNYRLVERALLPSVPDQLTALGFNPQTNSEWLVDFNESEHLSMNIEDMEQLPIGTLLDKLRIGLVDQKYFTAVLLFGVQSTDHLQAIAENRHGVYFVNKVEETSQTLQDLSVLALIIIACSYLVILGGLVPRYGWRLALKIVLIPVAASLLTLSVLFLSSLPVNIFAVVGLILVPGMGTDYLILLSEAKSDQSAAVLSISLSMMTTLLSFGLLSLTSIAGVFGLTVSCGVLATFVLTSFFYKKA